MRADHVSRRPAARYPRAWDCLAAGSSLAPFFMGMFTFTLLALQLTDTHKSEETDHKIPKFPVPQGPWVLNDDATRL